MPIGTSSLYAAMCHTVVVATMEKQTNRTAGYDRSARVLKSFAAKQLKSRFEWTQVMRAMRAERIAEIGVWEGEFTGAVLGEQLESLQEYVLADPWRHLGDWNMPFNVEKARFDKIYVERSFEINPENLSLL